jgi:hypothetical protein
LSSDGYLGCPLLHKQGAGELTRAPTITRDCKGEKVFTAILIGKSKDPACVRTDKQTPYMAQNIMGVYTDFKFVKAMGQRGEILIYRDEKAELSDKQFEQIAAAEADKFLNPAKYRDLGKEPLGDAVRKELAAYKKQFGALPATA